MGKRIVEPTEYKWLSDYEVLLTYPEHITHEQVMEYIVDSEDEVPKQLYINNFKNLGLEQYAGENIWVCNFHKP